jgi:hypothetical protein
MMPRNTLVVVRSAMTNPVRPFSDAHRAQRPDQSPIDSPERHDVHGCNSRACRSPAIRQRRSNRRVCHSLSYRQAARLRSGRPARRA